MTSEASAGPSVMTMPASGSAMPNSRISRSASAPADRPTAAMKVHSPKSFRICAAADGSEPISG